MTNGATELWAGLRSAGVDTAFGLPGTQSIGLHEALRRSGIRSVGATTELGAAFMALGYFRATGRIAALSTIPGPGFTFALTGLAEALHDSAGLIHLFGRAPPGTRPFQFQAIDQHAIAGPLLKGLVEIRQAGAAAQAAVHAALLAGEGEPGPVGLEWDADALQAPCEPWRGGPPPASAAPIDPMLHAEAVRRLRTARRPLILAGGGACNGAAAVQSIAESLNAPVLTTVSGRGVLPEDHRLALGWDATRADVERVNELVRCSDCVLVLGCKLTAASTVIFRLELPPDRLIRVDASREVMAAGYPAGLSFTTTVEAWARSLLHALPVASNAPVQNHWTELDVDALRKRLRGAGERPVEPFIHGVESGSASALFGSLRRVLPRNAIVVTDSGMHQELARRHLDVLAPRGLITPSDFQSMAFGLPAAIGAAIAEPGRPVVAVIGDGGFAMSGMELLTAVRERIPLTVLVLADGRFNRIRLQQFEQFGRSEGVDLLNPDFAAFADAVGARHVRIDGNAEEALSGAMASGRVSLVEVGVGDSGAIRLSRARGMVKQAARDALGNRFTAWWRSRKRR